MGGFIPPPRAPRNVRLNNLKVLNQLTMFCQVMDLPMWSAASMRIWLYRFASNLVTSAWTVLDREGDALLGHNHFRGVPGQCGLKLLGTGLQEGEGGVMARDDGFQIEKSFDCEGGSRRAQDPVAAALLATTKPFTA